MQGVSAIAHTASPFHTRADEPDELIVPAVQGTTSVLRSAARFGGPALKRIAVTSSCAAVLDPGAPRLFSEADWNEASIAEVRAHGRAAPGIAKYRASKTLAERAAWAFYEENKASVGWDLVVLNPPFVFGPVLHLVDAPEKLNSSMLEWFDTVVKGAKDNAALISQGCVHGLLGVLCEDAGADDEAAGRAGSMCATSRRRTCARSRSPRRAASASSSRRVRSSGKTGVRSLFPPALRLPCSLACSDRDAHYHYGRARGRHELRPEGNLARAKLRYVQGSAGPQARIPLDGGQHPRHARGLQGQGLVEAQERVSGARGGGRAARVPERSGCVKRKGRLRMCIARSLELQLCVSLSNGFELLQKPLCDMKHAVRTLPHLPVGVRAPQL